MALDDPWPAFKTCWQRIDRAHVHHRAFAEFWDRFVEEKPYARILNIRDDGRGGVWLEPRYQTFPPTLGIYLGEMLYQLRAALDSCIYDAVCQELGVQFHGEPPDARSLEFPICTSPQQFKDARWKLGPLSDQRRGIVEAVQPYHAAQLSPEDQVSSVGRSLGILNDWARKDRHRRLHVMGSWASRALVKVHCPPGICVVFLDTYPGGTLEYGSKLASFRLDPWRPGIEIEVETDFTVEVSLDEGPPPCVAVDTFDHRLRAIMHAVREVAHRLETCEWRPGAAC